MARVKIRHLVGRARRDGTSRWFWSPSKALAEKGWTLTRLADDKGTAHGQAEAINAVLDAWRGGDTPAAVADSFLAVALAAAPPGVVAGDDRKPAKGGIAAPKPGTLGDLIAKYRRGAHFARLAPKTRRSYEENLRVIETWAGEAPASALTPARWLKLHEQLAAATPSRAHAVIRMGQALFSWAMAHDLFTGYVVRGQMVARNPCQKLNLSQPRPDRGEADLWTDEEIAIFSAVAEMMGLRSVGLSVELNAWMGQRKGDVLSADRDRYQQGTLTISQSKTSARVQLPISLVPELAAGLQAHWREGPRKQSPAGVVHLDEQRSPGTLLVCESTGRGWLVESYKNAFGRVRTEAAAWCPSLARRTYMLLRHTAVVRLAEAGCTNQEIAAVTGHTLASVNGILERYSVRTRKLAENAFRKRLLAVDGVGEQG